MTVCHFLASQNWSSTYKNSKMLSYFISSSSMGVSREHHRYWSFRQQIWHAYQTCCWFTWEIGFDSSHCVWFRESCFSVGCCTHRGSCYSVLWFQLMPPCQFLWVLIFWSSWHSWLSACWDLRLHLVVLPWSSVWEGTALRCAAMSHQDSKANCQHISNANHVLNHAPLSCYLLACWALDSDLCLCGSAQNSKLCSSVLKSCRASNDLYSLP